MNLEEFNDEELALEIRALEEYVRILKEELEARKQ